MKWPQTDYKPLKNPCCCWLRLSFPTSGPFNAASASDDFKNKKREARSYTYEVNDVSMTHVVWLSVICFFIIGHFVLLLGTDFYF